MTTVHTNTKTQKVDNYKKVNNYNIVLSIKVNNDIYNSFLELKNSRHIAKDSVLLRPVIRAGITTCAWLNDKGLLSLDDHKLAKILDGLNEGERLELFEMLRDSLGV